MGAKSGLERRPSDSRVSGCDGLAVISSLKLNQSSKKWASPRAREREREEAA